MNKDTHRIDGHKLMLHPQRVADWLAGKDIAPLYMEVSPSGICNHRCVFCGIDFMGYQNRFIPLELWRERVGEMGEIGVKSIMFSGEGEPFLHKHMPEMALATHAAGIDISFTSNGVLLTPEKADVVLPVTAWIKISCNAGSPETYAKIHNCRPSDFERVFENLGEAVKLRKKYGYACTLGFQMLLLPENMHEVESLALKVRELGCDYLVIKPYSQHPQSHTRMYQDIQYGNMQELAAKLGELDTPSFKAILRVAAMGSWDSGEKGYDKCLALPFWSYVDAGCNVFGCSMFLNDPNFNYGNLREQSFTEIWHGEKRRQCQAWCGRELDAHTCRVNCRMHLINSYLWELTHPGPHVNFI